MKIFWTVLKASFAIAVLVLVCAFLSIAFSHISDAAAWVQAVGSIAALGVAIYIMSRQNLHSAKLVSDADRRATLRRANAVYALMENSHHRIMCISKWAMVKPDTQAAVEKADNNFTAAKDMLVEIKTTLKAVPLHDLGSYEMAAAVNAMLEVTVVFHRIADGLQSNPSASGQPDTLEVVDTWANNAKKAMNQFEKGRSMLEEKTA